MNNTSQNKLDLIEYSHKFEIVPLKEDTDVSYFQSRFSTYSEFLKKTAKKTDKVKATKTFLIQDKKSHTIQAYFSIFPDNVEISYSGDMQKKINIPTSINFVGAIQIHQLAASIEFEDNYHHIVKYIVQSVEYLISQMTSFLNIRFISLYADNESGNKNVVEIYKKAGFAIFEDKQTPETTFMIYDIYPNS